LKEAQEELKTCEDERIIENLKTFLSFRKYGNKRILVPKDEMWEEFESTSVVYLDIRVENAGCDIWPHYSTSLAYEVANEMRGCSPLRINCVQ
jgi:hypothetical protein